MARGMVIATLKNLREYSIDLIIMVYPIYQFKLIMNGKLMHQSVTKIGTIQVRGCHRFILNKVNPHQEFSPTKIGEKFPFKHSPFKQAFQQESV